MKAGKLRLFWYTSVLKAMKIPICMILFSSIIQAGWDGQDLRR
jgi:hypothetical protein